jgi:hypothetical protein
MSAFEVFLGDNPKMANEPYGAAMAGDAWQGIPMPGTIGQAVPTHATTEFPVGRARGSQASTGLPPECSSPPQDAAY